MSWSLRCRKRRCAARSRRPRHHQGPGQPAERGAPALRAGRHFAGRRADAGGDAGADARHAAAVAEAVGADTQPACRAGRALPQPGRRARRSSSTACSYRRTCRSACRRSWSISGLTCGRRRRSCTRHRPMSAWRPPTSCRSSRITGVAWHRGDRLHQHVRAGIRCLEHRRRYRADVVRCRHAAAQEARRRRGVRAAAAQYRSTVIKAFQNVADALRALQSDADALVAQSAAERLGVRQPRSGAAAIPVAGRSIISRC